MDVTEERFNEMRNQLGSMITELKEAFEKAEQDYYKIKLEKGTGYEVDDAFEDLGMYHSLYLHVNAAHKIFAEIEMAPAFREIDREIEREQEWAQ